MGYSKKKIEELEETIKNTPCDLVVIGTPVDLRQIMKIDKPAVRLTYELKEVSKPDLEEILHKDLQKLKKEKKCCCGK